MAKTKALLREFLFNNPVYDYLYMSRIRKSADADRVKPEMLRIELTNLCNTSCIMCPRDKLTRPQGVMSNEVFERAVKQALALGVGKILFSGFGEPLIDANIIERIKYAKKSGISLVHLFSNASLMTEKIAAGLANSGLDLLVISLDATEEKRFSGIKPGLNFNGVTSNIIFLLDYLNENNRHNPKVKVRLTGFENEIYDMWLLDQLRKKGAQVVSPGLHSWSGQWEGADFSPVRLMQGKRWPCYLLWTSATLLWDGSVSLCCKDFNCIYNFGNIKNEGLAEILQGAKLADIRRRHLERSFAGLKLCASCESVQAIQPWWRIKAAVQK